MAKSPIGTYCQGSFITLLIFCSCKPPWVLKVTASEHPSGYRVPHVSTPWLPEYQVLSVNLVVLSLKQAVLAQGKVAQRHLSVFAENQKGKEGKRNSRASTLVDPIVTKQKTM